MNKLIIHHAKCIDGLTALWAVLQCSDYVAADIHAADYGMPPPDVTGKDVVIVDFSYPRDVMEDMISKANTLLCLDHHKTAEENLAGLPGCVFDMNQSGAGMAWRHFHPHTEVPLIVQHVEDRDIWRKALPYTEDVNACIGSVLDFSRSVETNLYALTHLNLLSLLDLVERGRPLWENHLAHVAAATSGYFYVTLQDGTEIPCALATFKVASDVGNALCKHSSSSTSLVITNGGNGKFGLSFRSTSEGAKRLAEMYGGGGHLNAAGAGATPEQVAAILATRRDRDQ